MIINLQEFKDYDLSEQCSFIYNKINEASIVGLKKFIYQIKHEVLPPEVLIIGLCACMMKKESSFFDTFFEYINKHVDFDNADEKIKQGLLYIAIMGKNETVIKKIDNLFNISEQWKKESLSVKIDKRQDIDIKADMHESSQWYEGYNFSDAFEKPWYEMALNHETIFAFVEKELEKYSPTGIENLYLCLATMEDIAKTSQILQNAKAYEVILASPKIKQYLMKDKNAVKEQLITNLNIKNSYESLTQKLNTDPLTTQSRTKI